MNSTLCSTIRKVVPERLILRGSIDQPRKADEIDRFLRAPRRLPMRLTKAAAAQEHIPPGDVGEWRRHGQKVLHEIEIIIDAHRLKRAQKSGARDPLRGKVAYIAVLKPDASRIRLLKSGNAIDCRRLAGAIRTDEARDRSLLDAKRRVADGVDAAIGLAQSGNFEKRHASFARRALRRRS